MTFLAVEIENDRTRIQITKGTLFGNRFYKRYYYFLFLTNFIEKPEIEMGMLDKRKKISNFAMKPKL